MQTSGSKRSQPGSFGGVFTHQFAHSFQPQSDSLCLPCSSPQACSTRSAVVAAWCTCLTDISARTTDSPSELLQAHRHTHKCGLWLNISPLPLLIRCRTERGFSTSMQCGRVLQQQKAISECFTPWAAILILWPETRIKVQHKSHKWRLSVGLQSFHFEEKRTQRCFVIYFKIVLFIFPFVEDKIIAFCNVTFLYIYIFLWVVVTSKKNRWAAGM